MVRGEPLEHEIREEANALRLARLTLREQPQGSVQAQGTARHSHQKRVGISDEARQYRDAQPLARCENLGLGVCGFECRSVDGNVVVARPIGNAFVVPDDPADGTVRTSSPVGKQSA